MTKDAVIDVVHKTILGFFDVVADDSEEPMNEKDKLLLEVNKAVCNAIKDMPDDECKTGKWISEIAEREDWKGIKRKYFQPNSCSVCHEPSNIGEDYPYCPHCGAKMKGAEE